MIGTGAGNLIKRYLIDFVNSNNHKQVGQNKALKKIDTRSWHLDRFLSTGTNAQRYPKRLPLDQLIR